MTDKKSTSEKSVSTVDYYVHPIIPNGRQDRIGPSIGVAFNNKSGNGLTMYLDAQPIPIDGQVKLVVLKPNPNS